MTDSTGKAARLEEERFHDLVHSVNSDGLQGMALPGRRKSKTEKSDGGKGTKEAEGTVGDRIGQGKGTDGKGQSTEIQPKTTPVKAGKDNKKSKTEPKVNQKTEKRQVEQPLPQIHPIEGEWKEFCQNFKDYKIRKVKTKRVAVFLPESVWNTYQTVHNRDTSAAISVILEMFIKRNKENMRESITLKSTLL